MSASPQVSVLLSVHRDRGGLRRTIEQVLAQSMGELELIVVDDGSRDRTPQLLAELAADPRVRVLTNPQNLGLTPSLNRGLDAARAPWIARIDEGDGWQPTKLAAQLARAAEQPDLILIGTQARYVDAQSDAPLAGPRLPEGDAALRRALISAQNPFIHSSVLFRRLPGVRYNAWPALADRAMDTISDYELWLRLSLVGRLANLPQPLVSFAYAGGHSGLTTERAPLQFDLKRRIWRAFVRALEGDAARALRVGLDPGSELPADPSLRRRLSFALRYRAASAPGPARAALRAAGYALDPRDLGFHLRTKVFTPAKLWAPDLALRRQLEASAS